ncbi:MAG: AAA family ATPase, partial [Gemmatimonadota bacterium]
MKATLDDVSEAVRNGQVDLLVVPMAVMTGRGRFDLESLLRDAPGMASIGTAPHVDAELILAGMRSGIGEFLVTPPSPTDLESALVRLQRKWGAAPVRGVVTAVYSPKGGTGTTTVSVNLAHILARRRPDSRVAIVDLNMGLGDVLTHLNLEAEYDVGDVARKLDQLDTELLHAIVTPFGDGLFVLPASDDLEMADAVQADAVSRILTACRSGFSHTIIDCEHSFGPRTVAALDTADRIVLVLQSNVAAIRSIKRTLALFQQLEYGPERVVIAVNR